MDFLLLYGQPVKITQGFYMGLEGTVASVTALDEAHVDEDRPTLGYNIKLPDGHITALVHEYYIEAKKPPPKPKAKLIDIAPKPPKK